MKVAVRNNALRECIQAIGASETGDLLAYLVKMIPNGILFREQEKDVLVSAFHSRGKCQVIVGGFGILARNIEMYLPSLMDRYQDVVSSRCLIEGLTFIVLGCLPAEGNAGAAAGLFEWEERPDPIKRASIFDIKWNGAVLPNPFNYQIITMDYGSVGQVGEVMYWIDKNGIGKAEEPEEYKYEESTLHKREVNI